MPSDSDRAIALRRPQFLLLDALNTLAGLCGDYVGFFTEMSRQGGIEADPLTVKEALEAEYKLVRAYQRGRTDYSVDPQRERAFWHKVDQEIFQRIGFNHRASEMADRAFEAFESGRHFMLFEYTLPALRKIKESGLPIGIVSNGTPGMERWMKSSPLAEIAEFILVSSIVGWEKPGPEIFQMALTQAGVAPAEALFVGDSYEFDVMGAQGAGLPVVWLGKRANPAIAPCPVLKHIGELPDFLETLK